MAKRDHSQVDDPTGKRPLTYRLHEIRFQWILFIQTLIVRKIGKIEITTFGESTASELKEGIESLRKKGAKSFILDVRQNPGGLLDQVQIMASMF